MKMKQCRHKQKEKFYSLNNLFLVIIFFIGFLAQAVYTFAQAPTEKALLWKIETSDKTIPPSYLFGTFHLLCAEDVQVYENLKQAFQNTQQLFLEVNVQASSLMQTIFSHAIMRNDTVLQQLYTSAQYDTLSTQFAKLSSVPFMLLQKLQPLLSASFIVQSLLNCTNTKQWEMVLAEMAAQQNKEIKGLETAEEQLNILDSIPYKTQATMLLEAVKNTDSSRKELQTTIALYKAQDIAQLEKLAAAGSGVAYNNLFITQRNKTWLRKMMPEINTKPTFFAVGAAHLGGEEGLIALLKQQGYQLTPVVLK
jgi:uncharacterized protein YbaP (TraB family)